MTLSHHYTAIQIIASIVISTFMLVFFIIIPIVKAERNARNKRAFQKWRENHGQPYYGNMEEETEMDFWEVEHPCDNPLNQKQQIKTFRQYINKVDTLQTYFFTFASIKQ